MLDLDQRMKTKVFDVLCAFVLLASTNQCHVRHCREWSDCSRLFTISNIIPAKESMASPQSESTLFANSKPCRHSLRNVLVSLIKLRLKGGYADNTIQSNEFIAEDARKCLSSVRKDSDMDVGPENEIAVSDVSFASCAHRGRSRHRTTNVNRSFSDYSRSPRSDECEFETNSLDTNLKAKTSNDFRARLLEDVSRASDISRSRSSSPADAFDAQQIASSASPSVFGGNNDDPHLDR